MGTEIFGNGRSVPLLTPVLNLWSTDLEKRTSGRLFVEGKMATFGAIPVNQNDTVRSSGTKSRYCEYRL